MISREKRLIITFRWRLIPVPRAISASCGLSWCANLNSRQSLEELLSQQDLQPEGIYECMI